MLYLKKSLSAFPLQYRRREKTKLFAAGLTVLRAGKVSGLALNCRFFHKKTDTLGAPVLQRRKPRLLFSLSGLLLFQLPTCRLFASLFQLPQRLIRFEPLHDTFPKSLKFLAKPRGNPLDPLKRPFFYAPFGAEEWPI